LDRIDRVEYVLHEAYPNPIQVRTRRDDRFLLKEVANGEYVLLARVFISGRSQPLVLQRFITLWKEGPRI
jgi:transcription initiation factor IIF auxiliary subunit